MSYEQKLEHFRLVFEKHNNDRKKRLYPNLKSDKIAIEQGYKFDKVYVINGDSEQSIGRYMVESRTGNIYGIKSWTQVNRRRQYGTLDIVDQYDWSEHYGRPLPGTQAEKNHVLREAEITSAHKKRGRKPKVASLSS